MDFDANFEVAQIFESTDPKLALKYHETGVKIMRDHISSEEPFRFMAEWSSSFEDPQKHKPLTMKTVPPEILCNYAVLLLHDEDRRSEAMPILQEALANCEIL